MIEERARVIAVEQGRVWVEAAQQSACGACAARAGCGTSVLGKVLGVKPVRVEVDARRVANLQPGEQVRIALDESTLVQGTLWLYGLPLLLLLSGAAFGTFMAPRTGLHPDFAAVLGAVLGLGLALLFLRRQLRPQALPQVLSRESTGLVQLLSQRP